MAYEQRPGFALKPKPDFRIVRLVNCIMQCEQLASHFFNKQKIEFACKYNQVDFTSIDMRHSEIFISEESLGLFLDRLNRNSQVTFAEFIAYMLRYVLAEYSPPSFWGLSNEEYFADFVKDLRALGYEYGWKGGTSVTVIPIVLGGAEEARVTDELDDMLRLLDPSLVATRRGAWDALLSDNADGDRQAIASSRQLLSEALRLAGKGETREERVNSILNNKDAAALKAIGNLLMPSMTFNPKENMLGRTSTEHYTWLN